MYSYELNVGYSVSDASLRMTVPAILDCFQDAAIFESYDNGITVEYLYSKNMIWLLSSWQIVIDRRPRLNEKIKIMTAPYDFKGFLGYRNFMAADEEENTIIKAASIWTLIDTRKQLPTRVTQELIDRYKFDKKLDMEYAPRKISLLDALDSAEDMGRFKVRKFQIDSNRHMNNVQYVRLAMESLPEKGESGIEIKELRAEYKKAAVCGDEISAMVLQAEDKHQVVLNDITGDTYAVVEFKLV